MIENINPNLFKKPTETNIEKLENLNNFLKTLSEKFQKENLPVKENCRIDQEKYSEIFKKEEIIKDKEKVLTLEEQWFQERDETKIEEKKIKKAGEQLEMIKTAILNKFLYEKFYVVRASLYDDIFNKVDNVILNKNTGEIICAFDEVEDIKGEKFKEKKEKVLLRNQRGVALKYGLKLENNQIKLTSIENLPIFYIALPNEYLEKAINNFEPEFEKKSECEKMFFNFFLSLVDKEIKEIYRRKIEIDPIVLDKIENFQKNLKKLKTNKEKSSHLGT
ncbi:MAG: hypothetical protein AB7D02_02090 [Candidatus Paceibacterota bacterium]